MIFKTGTIQSSKSLQLLKTCFDDTHTKMLTLKYLLFITVCSALLFSVTSLDSDQAQEPIKPNFQWKCKRTQETVGNYKLLPLYDDIFDWRKASRWSTVSESEKDLLAHEWKTNSTVPGMRIKPEKPGDRIIIHLAENLKSPFDHATSTKIPRALTPTANSEEVLLRNPFNCHIRR
jgi:hypothetical protein